ncbi:helix-turn-helix transcriptional regulator [Paenibacillus sp. 1P07SE]|uniref:AraC family transcriptional regulator n=1 Tax=Paenibacillus sp. 1P07SE TaxID=3132209 RepID=UPI0039A62D19
MKRKYYLKLFVILLFLTILPVIFLSAIHYYMTTYAMEKEVRLTNEVLLQNSQNVIDTKIESIRTDFMAYVISDRTFDLLQRGYVEPAEMHHVLMDLRMFKTKYDYIGEIFFYDMKKNIVLTTAGSYDPDYFLEEMQLGLMNPWIAEPQFFSINTMHHFQTGRNVFGGTAISSTVPLRSDSYSMFISIVLDNRKIVGDLNKLHEATKGFTIITDAEDNVIFSGKGNPVPLMHNQPIPSELAMREGANRLTLQDQSYITVETVSKFTNWHYTAYVPYAAITGKFQTIQFISLLITASVVIIGLLLAVFSSRSLYSPIRKLTGIFQMEEKRHAPDNEFSFLDGKIQSMLRDNKDMELELLAGAKVLQHDFIRKMARGQLDPETLKEMASKYNVHLPHQYSMVVLLECKAELKAEDIHAALESSFLHYFLLEEGARRYMLLLNLNKLETLELLGSLFADQPIAAACGHVVSELTEIADSAATAQQRLDYRCIRDGFELLDDEAMTRYMKQADRYLYDIEQEKKLLLCMEAGSDKQSALEVFETMLDQGAGEQTPLIYLQQNVEKLCTLLRKLYTSNQLALPLVTSAQLLKKTVKHGNLEPVKGELRRQLEQLMTHLDSQSSDGGSLMEDVLVFIDEMYMKELSLNMIADEFQISYHYLSKIFKQHTGLMYSEYISKLRIEKAKELLKDDSFKIKQIAELVGYNNAVSFNRNFKKYVGVAPGQYVQWLVKKG